MRTAFVTGATRGTGRAIATALAQSGWQVFAIGRDRRALEELRADHGIVPLAMDITDRDEMRTLTAELHIDALVNAALRWPESKRFVDYEEAEIDMTMEVNLSAGLHLTRSLLPGMAARKSGAVLFVVPEAAPERSALQATVSGALSAFATVLAEEFGESGVVIECLTGDCRQPDNMAIRVVEILDARIKDQNPAGKGRRQLNDSEDAAQ